MKKHSQKILRILAITSMLAIFTQSTLVSASTDANVNANLTVTAGSLGVTAGGTAALHVGALGATTATVCDGSADPAVSTAVQTLCTNITAVVVTDLRAYPQGWAVSTQLKHLTYVDNTVKKLTGSTLTTVSGVSPFDVNAGPYSGDLAHTNGRNLMFRFQIHTAGVRTGESGTTGRYIMHKPDGTQTTAAGIAIPSDGDVDFAGLTFNFANVSHVLNDVYIVRADAIHMFQRDSGSEPAITATTKFQPGVITAHADSTLLGGDGNACVVAGSANNDVDEKDDSTIISEHLGIMGAQGGCGKGQFTINVGVETLLYANSSSSANFTAAIVVTVA